MYINHLQVVYHFMNTVENIFTTDDFQPSNSIDISQENSEENTHKGSTKHHKTDVVPYTPSVRFLPHKRRHHIVLREKTAENLSCSESCSQKHSVTSKFDFNPRPFFPKSLEISSKLENFPDSMPEFAESWLKFRLGQLNLQLQQNNQIYMKKMSPNDLIQEKKRIKMEISMFSSAFNIKFNHHPHHKDREFIRPLFSYYNTIKETINISIGDAPSQKLNKQETPETIKRLEQNNAEMPKTESNISQSLFSTRPTLSHTNILPTHSTSPTENSCNLSHTYGSNSTNLYPSNNQPTRASSPKQKPNPGSNIDSNLDFKAHSTPTSTPAHTPLSDPPQPPHITPVSTLITQVPPTSDSNKSHNMDHHNSFQSLKELEFTTRNESDPLNHPSYAFTPGKYALFRQLLDIEEDNKDIKKKLEKYQKDFSDLNGRQIQFEKDIFPVKEIYNSYRKNKIKIKELKSLLS